MQYENKFRVGHIVQHRPIVGTQEDFGATAQDLLDKGQSPQNDIHAAVVNEDGGAFVTGSFNNKKTS